MRKINKIVVMGAGGVGYWLVLGLCRVVDIPIVVYDHDNFQGGTGFKRLPKSYDPTKSKVSLLRNQCNIVMGDRPPIIHDCKFDLPILKSMALEARLDLSNVLIVDCTDMPSDVRQELWNTAAEFKANMIRTAYDGTGECVVASGLPFWKTNAVSSGYAIEPHIGHSFATAGLAIATIIKYLDGFDLDEISFTI